MDLLADLARTSIPAFVLLLFGVQVAAREVGLWFGQRDAARESARESVGVVVGAMLGLLAFVLALTLASSTSRFQERRQAMLAEASAISTAWGRAEAIGGPAGEEISRLMRDYTQLRVTFIEAPADQAALAGIAQRSAALQAAMMAPAAALARAEPNTLTVSLLNALDDAFSATAATRFAFSARMLPQLFWLLLGMTLVSVGALGYQIGLRGQTLRVLSLLVVAMWTAVITDILDLGSARTGVMNHDTAVYHWVMEEFPLRPPPG